jgi:cell division control protein 6
VRTVYVPVELMVTMDIASYLKRLNEQLNKESEIIKDYSVFDFHSVPDKPVLRSEATSLIDELAQFNISGIPTHLAVVGSRGSGKTLTVRYLQRIVQEELNVEILYANCRHHNTSFRVLAHLLDIRARGASMGEVFERFCARCRKKTVVILDEVDLMSPKDRRREILYLLSRASKPFMVIMLSNSPQVLKELDAATRSSLQPVPVHFKNYNAQQIHEILRDRAERGLHRWNEADLAEIAALTTKLSNADARLAIKTLQYRVTGRGKDLRACFERARRDLVVDLITDLSDGTLSILWAAADSKSDFARSIYERYSRISRQRREKPFSYVHFHSNLSYLQSAGLVALVSTKQERTFATRVLLTFDPAVARQISTLRFDQ